MWLLLFAVIMDSHPGHVDHRGCVPHTQALRSLDISGGFGTVISAVCTCLLCPVPFSMLLLLRRLKNSGTESLLCAAVCFIHCIKPYMLSALLPCLSERQTTYPAGAIMIRIKMLISSFTSDGAKPCSIVMRLFVKCTRIGNSRFLFFS